MGGVRKRPSTSQEEEFEKKLQCALSSVPVNPDDRFISPRATEGDTTENESFSEGENIHYGPDLDGKSQISAVPLPQMGPMRTGRAASAAEPQSSLSEDCSIVALKCVQELHKQVKLLKSFQEEQLEINQFIRGDLQEAVGHLADMKRALGSLERREPGARNIRRTAQVSRSPQ
ncbi:hypothetical protein N7540_013003 [Penicillium herquei]|nr:hypothetical protein N7540_013003 [Penicillium herquei]